MAFPDLDPNQVFRDFTTHGVPASGKWDPRKVEIRRLLKSYESAIIALIGGEGGDIDLVRGVIYFSVTGGTANDIIAEPDAELPENPGSTVYIIGGIAQDNTGAVTINGKSLLTNSGNQIAAGGLVAGGIYLFLDDGTNFRLVSDQASAAIVAAAEAAQEAAEEARDLAESAAGSNISNVDSVSTAETISFPILVGYVRTAGHAGAGDGGAAVYKRALSEPGHAGKFQSADGAWWELAEKRPTPYHFGGKIDGVTDDTVAYQDLCAFCAATGSDPDFGSGYAIVSGQITMPLNRTIYGGNITLDFSAVGDSANFPDGACLYVDGGGPLALPTLAANVSRGGKLLTFSSAPDLVTGDIVIIRNPTDGSFNSIDLVNRAYYRAGEYTTVRSVAGSAATIWDGLIDDYAAADVTVHRFARDNSLKLAVGRLKVIAPTVVGYGVVLRRLRNATHDNLKVIGGQFGACFRQECYNISGENVVFEQDLLSGQGVDYGLVDGGCHITKARGIFKGMRHGYTAGNGNGLTVPCRFMNISGDFYTGRTATTIGAANAHGNCEFWKFSGNFYGPVNFGGDKGRVEGDIFVENSNRPGLTGTELLGLDHDFTGVRIFARGNNSGSAGTRGILDAGGGNPCIGTWTRRGGTLKFESMVIDAPDTTRLLTVVNNGRVNLSGNMDSSISLRGSKIMGQTGNIIRVSVVSGDNFDLLDASNIDNQGGSGFFTAGCNRVRGWRESGSIPITGDTGATFVDQVVTFNQPAPKAPKVVVSISGAPNIGSARLISGVTGEGQTQFTARLMTANNVNFPSADARTINWVATVDE